MREDSVKPLPAPDTDAELEALPPPRHPFRKVTLFAMALTLVASLALLASLRGELWFSLQGGVPLALGELSHFQPSPADANHWVQGEGELEVSKAVAFSRPLERDSYRLAKVTGTKKLWVQLRVPQDDVDPEHLRFVPPTSFVGRLVPLGQAGLRLSGLQAAVAEAGGSALPNDAWLLVDGEAPVTTRWTLGLAALLLGFAAFNSLGLRRLLRPAL